MQVLKAGFLGVLGELGVIQLLFSGLFGCRRARPIHSVDYGPSAGHKPGCQAAVGAERQAVERTAAACPVESYTSQTNWYGFKVSPPAKR